MGWIRHHAIIVTSWDTEAFERARDKAHEIFKGLAPEAMASESNGYRTFLIPPDGSREGWSESETGDSRRAHFIEWLDAQRHSDDSSPFDWVEVQYGDDQFETEIVNDSDAKARARHEQAKGIV
ncbi:MAG: hypothetical protein GY906_39065 [bacterium]|nr:hypothetical protein [bacterium]